VYVKAGASGPNLYRYDPPYEATGDTNLVSPGTSGNGISPISFGYDQPDATPTPTPTPTPTLTPTPTPTPTEEPTDSVREGELGGNPTPTGAPLPDTAMGEWGQVPATVMSLLLLGSLAGMVYVRLARQR